jgi:hypothetical protein
VSTDPPAEFGAAFLSWLREATEAAWQHVDEWTVDDYASRGYIGPRWRRGTRWTGGLDDLTIAEVERVYGVGFPPQYRLFLQTLHSTTPWRTGADYSQGERLALYESPGFYDWRHDETQIRQAMLAVEDRTPFAEEIASHHGGSRWLPGGPSPALIPVLGHRYVVADDSQWVLSIVGADAIVYGEDLRVCLLSELGGLLG